MSLWLTVLTSPKRQEYLADTLRSWEAAGADFFEGWSGEGRKIVFVDGEVGEIDPAIIPFGWTVSPIWIGGASRGNTRSMFRVLQMAGAAFRNVERLVFSEDDVKVARRAFRDIVTYPLFPGYGFATFCNLNGPAVQKPSSGLDTYVGHVQHIGNQCLLFDTMMLRAAAAYELSDELAATPADLVAGLLFGPWDAVSPSLVQHVGDRSLDWPGKTLKELGRQAQDFRDDLENTARINLIDPNNSTKGSSLTLAIAIKLAIIAGSALAGWFGKKYHVAPYVEALENALESNGIKVEVQKPKT